MLGDVQGAGVIEEVTPDGVGCGGFASGEVAGEEAVEVAGDDGEGRVEVCAFPAFPEPYEPG